MMSTSSSTDPIIPNITCGSGKQKTILKQQQKEQDTIFKENLRITKINKFKVESDNDLHSDQGSEIKGK